ncbi:MAG TPA: biopolymer transporter ExbD [Terracidiphilus sp.]|nr:biopolymer transporter ExbD [Terracidiphilus sp.]
MAFTSSSGDTRTSLAEINVTPLVDVVLVLLIIFMITEPVLQSGIQVNVPKTHTTQQITQQRMLVTIDANQNVFLNDKPINLHALTGTLRSKSSDPAKQTIYLAADKTIPFDVFCSVMDAVKQAGITNVSIITQPLNTKKTGAGGD